MKLISLVSGYAIKGSVVNCRPGPGTSHKVVLVYKKGAQVTLSCQTPGTDTQHGCYVSDYYVNTGNGYVAEKCSKPNDKPKPCDKPCDKPDDNPKPGDKPSTSADPMKDVYPYKDGASVSTFVVRWINSRLGIDFNNHYKDKRWDNANEWDDAAHASGVTVSNTPKPGAISGNSVTTEEYNYKHHKYGTWTVPKSSFGYTHLKKQAGK
ncbi:hypothetical protein DL89DRAFT_320456 [Linderina pennispora]|uniref:SH3b domain-containing protein n=1 Tax=Linderina pennispora TaxID=61395 RepID=A0A1Y1WGH6_9FUNG|nr:uncharacterized protein DL89DRAFT_320456 [Linderina pennispora]ORX72651.1 hypothetical protein DL89DRAFT_320456 [Linderina pennispora]